MFFFRFGGAVMVLVRIYLPIKIPLKVNVKNNIKVITLIWILSAVTYLVRKRDVDQKYFL